MTEPHIRAKGLTHVVTLKCTSVDLFRLAEMARAHDLSRSEVPFWTMRSHADGPIEVQFCLDRDEEISARAAEK